MEQKDFEEKMDQTARKFSDTVADGVKKIEEAFDKGKGNLRDDIKGSQGMENIKGSPRLGVIMLAGGLLWLLNSIGVFNSWMFPVALMVVGAYFIFRSRKSNSSE